MSSWVCVSGELVEWSGEWSVVSSVSSGSLRCWMPILWWWMNAPGISLYSTKGVSFMLIVWSSFEAKSSSEEPSCLRKHLASSIIILYYCLDSWTENNCPGYIRVTAYSFCIVLHRARSYPSGYSLVWSSTPKWLMLQTSNQRSWHVIIYLFPRANCW